MGNVQAKQNGSFDRQQRVDMCVFADKIKSFLLYV
jgi:hypothetical protein